MISERIQALQEKIDHACRQSARDPKDVTIVAVTKYTGIDQMRSAVCAGMCHIGESRVQDAAKKFEVLDAEGVACVKHMIGHLQRNKAKTAVDVFDLIQSVDSLKLAREIQKYARQADKNMDVLIQINAAREPRKSGVEPGKAAELIAQIREFSHVRVQGLMTIGPLTDQQEEISACFREVRDLYDRLDQDYAGSEKVHMKYLSMGMTHDFEIAIREGANMVRIGSAIFG
ncbi:MAG: YggS family pyridoxal phosphate-dependent enzyme [Candidatus Omnitrophota bacterium]